MLILGLIVEGSHRELPSLLVLRDASYEVNFLLLNSILAFYIKVLFLLYHKICS